MEGTMKRHSTDRKERWGGLLEHPWISRVQRNCLDGFKVQGLAKILKPFSFASLLDVCCGTGEYSALSKGQYWGLDNSRDHITYARSLYHDFLFVEGDAQRLPFKDRAFEAVLFACASHHFSEDALKSALIEMRRVSRRYVIFDDAVTWAGQSSLSRIFYRLDRGTMFRSVEELERIFGTIRGFKIVARKTHTTFPGIYRHAVFVLQLEAEA
jgi:ubiquinone/menaquinone biosynthesis C-methylase UbiE